MICAFPEPPRIVPFSFGREVFDEGEYAQISCIVSSGDLPLMISWSLQGSDSEISGGGRGITTAPMGARASFLSIDSVGSRHGGEYTCTARNKAGLASFSTKLRVNGNRQRRSRRNGRERVGVSIQNQASFDFALTEPPVIIPLTLGSDVLNEGQFVQILCTVTQGDEPLSLKWSLQGDSVSSEPELKTASLGTRTSMLTIQSVGYRVAIQ